MFQNVSVGTGIWGDPRVGLAVDQVRDVVDGDSCQHLQPLGEGLYEKRVCHSRCCAGRVRIVRGKARRHGGTKASSCAEAFCIFLRAFVPSCLSMYTPAMTQSTSSRATPLAHLGGGLGIAACLIGLLIFFVACAGFGAVFMLSILPVILGAIGFVLSIIGPIIQKHAHVEDSAVFAAIFLNILGIVGGLLLMSVWLNWQLFQK